MRLPIGAVAPSPAGPPPAASGTRTRRPWLWLLFAGFATWPGADPRGDTTLLLATPAGRFTARYREPATPSPHGAVVLLPGRQPGQDEGGIIGFLGRRLPERGWVSLTLELPDPGAAPWRYGREAAARIAAAIGFLRDRKTTEPALIGRDSGALVALTWILEQPDPAVRALVLIEPAPGDGPELPALPPERLARLGTPVLEIGGAAGGPTDRLHAALKSGPAYRRLVLHGLQHDGKDAEDFIANRIHGWLLGSKTPREGPETGGD